MGNIYALHFVRLLCPSRRILLPYSTDTAHTPMPTAAPWQKMLNAGITFRLCIISCHVSTVYSSSDSPPYFFSSFIVVLPIVIESVLYAFTCIFAIMGRWSVLST
jgi:hypothetical protein